MLKSSQIPRSFGHWLGIAIKSVATGMDSKEGQLRVSINYTLLAGSLEGDVNGKFLQTTQ